MHRMLTSFARSVDISVTAKFASAVCSADETPDTILTRITVTSASFECEISNVLAIVHGPIAPFDIDERGATIVER